MVNAVRLLQEANLSQIVIDVSHRHLAFRRVFLMSTFSSRRRDLLKFAIATATGNFVFDRAAIYASTADAKPLFKISIGEWTFHRSLFGKKLEHVDVAKVAKEVCGIDALEYSAQFFMDKAEDRHYLRELKQHAVDYNVKPLLITVDEQGSIGDPDNARRIEAVENHYKWIEAAKFLGCQSIRVNAFSDQKLAAETQAELVTDGLRKLVDFGADHEIDVLVENHGGLSSNGKWLAGVIKAVNRPTCGTLPDFGNFPSQPGNAYDRYQGVSELMPFAKGVSAKAYDFDSQGNEVTIDYRKMLKIVLGAGYHEYLGIEYEGTKLSEADGVVATKKLLETIRDEMARPT